MKYTDSKQSKILESFRLLKNSIVPKRQAENLVKTYENIQNEFNLENKRILELGAGSKGALITLFDDTNYVVGVDLYLGALEQGLWKAGKTATRKVLFDPFFRYYLKKYHGRPLINSREVLHMDAADLKFPDDSFDFVYSRHFLEHIEDIYKVADECERVLRPGGISFHVFSLYSLLDGAHTLDWKKYKPWEHLYGQVHGNCYVNKYRLKRYQDDFNRAFGERNVEFRLTPSKEAARYMTPEIRRKLDHFDDEELLVTSPRIIARKPVN